MEKRVGLAAMRIQPLGIGHCRIIDYMIRNFDVAIVAIGSSQKKRELANPWTFEERKQMVHNVYGDRVKIVQLSDLGTTEGTNDWVDYVINKIEKIGMPTPTDYLTGSKADARWYTDRFYLEGVSEGKGLEAGKFWTEGNDGGEFRKLHVIERTNSNIPAATELRTFLELGVDDWKEFVPAVNWDVVEQNFPDELKVGPK